MTLPEHLICSVMLAQLGCRQRFGWKTVPVVAVAGIAPDVDAVTKLISDPLYWEMHHALGHSLISITVLSAIIAGVSAPFLKLPFRPIFVWCWLASFVHDLTDVPYWWGVRFLWPFSDRGVMLKALEYLDLIVLAMWLTAAIWLWKRPARSRQIAIVSLSLYTGYVILRWILPKPTGIWHQITGGWMYLAPGDTPVLDWW
jgi:membrane-bound metal-dependent hydrolase YbcI (DUF457 family)